MKRTEEMNTKAAGMRILGLAILSYREKLASSSSSGEKLAAIMSLQVSPCPIYLDWLYDCIVNERSFIQYNSLLAIRSYVKSLPNVENEKIDKVILKINKISDTWGESTKKNEIYKELIKTNEERIAKLKQNEIANSIKNHF